MSEAPRQSPAANIPAGEGVLRSTEAVRMYSSSAIHAARYFRFVASDSNLLRVADELQADYSLPAVAVVDSGSGAVLGIVRRERLFALLGKPFGREVLRRSLVAELVEEVPRFDAHADLFAVAERMLPGAGAATGGGGEYCVLLGADGSFLALLASQDLANYLSRMTQDDIELAGRLQERLLAGEGCEDGGSWRVDAWSRPAKGVGGDFYFTKRLEDGRIFLALCDVSGKGVAASLIVSMVWGMLRMFDFRLGLKALVLGLNEAVVATFHLEKYLTGIFLIYDPRSGFVLYADMGHSHSMLFRAGRPRPLQGSRGNLPIGVETELDPAIYRFGLECGDELLLYSDGLIEQEGPSSEEFGEARLISLVASSLGVGKRLRDILPPSLDAHRGAIPQQDDMSFLLLSIV